MGNVLEAPELLSGSDLIKARLAAAPFLHRAGSIVQQDGAAIGLLPLLPQQTALLPDLVHPTLVVVRALLLGAGSSLGLLLIFGRLETQVPKAA